MRELNQMKNVLVASVFFCKILSLLHVDTGFVELDKDNNKVARSDRNISGLIKIPKCQKEKLV